MKILSIFLLSLTLMFTACGGGSSDEGTTKSTQFLSVPFTPAADTPIGIDKIVTMTFSAAIDRETADTTSIYIEDENRERIPASIVVSDSKISIIPTDYFIEDSRYTLVVTTDVADVDGLSLENTFSFTFTTSFGPDISPPSLVTYTPAEGSSVAPESNVTMEFDEVIVADDEGLFKLLNSDTNVSVAGITTVSDHQILFAPGSLLEHEGNYTATLVGIVKDVAGNEYNGTIRSWDFSVDPALDITAPSMVSLTPTDGTSADKATAIIMAFDERIMDDNASLEVKYSGTNTAIEGTSMVNDNTLNFVPTAELTPGEDYTVMVQGSVEDLAGNTYVGVTSWDFSVNPAVDSIAPAMLSLTPADGTSADKATTIIMAFDEDIHDSSASLEIIDSSTATVDGTLMINNNTVSFIPTSDLTPDEDYTVMLQGSVEDLAGNAYAGVTSWDFSVNPLVDSSAPAMLSLTPVDGTSADKGTNIIIAFGEEIADNGASLEVRDSSSDIVVGTSMIDDNTLSFIPTSDLIPGEDYTVTLQGSVQDLASNTYAGVTSWDFSVDPIVATMLTVTNIKRQGEKITIEFYEPLDPATVDGTDFLLNGGAIGLTGFIVKGGDWQVEFTADTTLTGDETITISGTVTDRLGNIHNGGIERDYSVLGLLTVWDVKNNSGLINVKFWEVLDQPIELEILDTSTVSADDFLIDGGAITFSDFRMKNDYEVEFTADTPLTGDEVITISGEIQDVGGNIHNYGIAVSHTFR